jgi:hypothetical protein
MKRDAIHFDPLMLLGAKRRVEADDADQIALLVLIALDAAKRGAAPTSLANTLTEHLLASAAVWSQSGNRKLYVVAVEAWTALRSACARPTEMLDLTTGEYKAIRIAISFYVRALPQIETGALAAAHAKALQQLRGAA